MWPQEQTILITKWN